MNYLIFSLATASYIAGFYEIVQKKYRPSLFTRSVLLLLAVNSFAALVVGDASKSVMALGSAYLGGNILIWAGSIWRGDYKFAKIELFSTVLLTVSGLCWILTDKPLLNLLLGIVANSSGLIPTYKRVLVDPKSESGVFWLLFFIASLLSLFTSSTTAWISLSLPLYFCITDGSLFFLTTRRLKDTSNNKNKIKSSWGTKESPN